VTETLVLLGAGASKEAGIPLTNELTAAVVAGCVKSRRDRLRAPELRKEEERQRIAAMPLGSPARDQEWEEWRRRYPDSPVHAVMRPDPIEYVYKRLRGRAAMDLEPGLEPIVDLELLVTVLDQLGRREEHGISAFVQQWNPDLLTVDHQTSGGWVTGLDARYGPEMTNFIEWVMEPRLTLGDGATFRGSRALVTSELPRHLSIPPGGTTSHLRPLVEWARDTLGTVATLNFDRALEVEAEQVGVRFDDGISQWAMSRELAFSSDCPRLVKLHGALGWEGVAGDGHPGFLLGGVNKLTATGPYLDLLHEFRHALLRADRLVVIGYSFRDEHINGLIKELIVDRAATGEPRVLEIVDPAFTMARLLPLGQALVGNQFVGELRLEVHEVSAGEALAGGLLAG
jgi:hypothetical protein